jgi:hypothetical protein
VTPFTMTVSHENVDPPPLEYVVWFTYQCTWVLAAAGVAVMMAGASARPPTATAEAVRATTRERSFIGPPVELDHSKYSKKDRA